MEELQRRIKLNERVARIFMALAAVCMVLDLLSPGGSWESTIIALGFSCYHHALSETLRVQMMVLNK